MLPGQRIMRIKNLLALKGSELNLQSCLQVLFEKLFRSFHSFYICVIFVIVVTLHVVTVLIVFYFMPFLLTRVRMALLDLSRKEVIA